MRFYKVNADMKTTGIPLQSIVRYVSASNEDQAARLVRESEETQLRDDGTQLCKVFVNGVTIVCGSGEVIGAKLLKQRLS